MGGQGMLRGHGVVQARDDRGNERDSGFAPGRKVQHNALARAFLIACLPG